MGATLDTVLLLALPASGKSEIRKYLSRLSPEECREEFHLGPTVQLDDFPYVHLMRRIDDELIARGEPRVFFHSPERPFVNPLDWGTLIQLINQDHRDLLEGKKESPGSAAERLIERIDLAAERVGAPARLSRLGPDVRSALIEGLQAEAREQIEERQRSIPDTLVGRTLVIEFARGGPQGSKMPLPAPLDYRYSLGQLSRAILEKAAILYAWVTPEESRRKNQERADPDDPGSILHHGVSIEVMLNDYGCDDIDWLAQSSKRPGTVAVEARGGLFHLPLSRFDNRMDKTTFVRSDPGRWKPGDVQALRNELKVALDPVPRRPAGWWRWPRSPGRPARHRSRGFVRSRCAACGFDRLVAFASETLP